MDLDKKTRGVQFKKRTNSQCRSFNNNTGRMYVKNVYDSIDGRSKSPKEKSKRKIFELFSRSEKTPRSSISVLQELIQNYEHTSVCSNQPLKPLEETSSVRKSQHFEEQNLSSKTFVRLYPCSDSSTASATYSDHKENSQQNDDADLEKIKIQNAKMQKIMSKLMTERRRQKQRETWNNYINELKNKHGYYSNEPNTIIPQYVPNEDPSEFFNDYNVRYQVCSDTCQQLLSDFYKSVQKPVSQPTYYECPPEINDQCTYVRPNPYYSTEYYCYPTSSQAQIMLINEKKNADDLFLIPSLGYGILEHSDIEYLKYCGYPVHELSFDTNDNRPVRNESPSGLTDSIDEKQTSSEDSETNVRDNEPCDKEDNVNVKQDTTKPSTVVDVKNLLTEKTGVKHFKSIESKIDSLITSINSFIVEIRATTAKRPVTESRAVLCKSRHPSNMMLNANQNTTYSLNKTDPMFLPSKNNSKTGVPLLKDVSFSKIDEIIREEKAKSIRIKRDIERLLHGDRMKRSSMQMAFEIPTRERSITVTSSLLKVRSPASEVEITRGVESHERGDSKFRKKTNDHMTMAVNTDPLGILALLQVSSETIKQLVLQSLDYSSYLPLLPMAVRETHYICEVCGTTVNSPAQLSEHAQYHNTMRPRDVYQHTHTLEEEQMTLFNCKYCGQKFIRAYCFELHQQACSRRSTPHEVDSLTILR